METAIVKPDRMPTMTEADRVDSRIKPYVIKSLRAGIGEVLGQGRIWLYGVKISVDEVYDYCLPALLLAAASNFSTLKDSKAARIDFEFDMKIDNAEVMYFKVTHISVSSPRVLKSAIMSALQLSRCEDEFVLNDLVSAFGEFVQDHVPVFEEAPRNEASKTFTIGVSKSSE